MPQRFIPLGWKYERYLRVWSPSSTPPKRKEAFRKFWLAESPRSFRADETSLVEMRLRRWTSARGFEQTSEKGKSRIKWTSRLTGNYLVFVSMGVMKKCVCIFDFKKAFSLWTWPCAGEALCFLKVICPVSFCPCCTITAFFKAALLTNSPYWDKEVPPQFPLVSSHLRILLKTVSSLAVLVFVSPPPCLFWHNSTPLMTLRHQRIIERDSES